MSDDSQALMPSSSATFALTLDQNVSRDVRKRVVDLEKKTRNAGVSTFVTVAGSVVGCVALAVAEPISVILGIYGSLFVVPVIGSIYWWRNKASSSASLLNQDRDVAFVGPDGLVFFADEGFFIEKRGGWKTYGVREPTPRRFDDVEYFPGNRTLVVSSSSGYSISIKVPHGWTERDTARVKEKLDGFTY